MNSVGLLNDLRGRGIELTPDNGDIWLSAPKGALTAELRSALTEHKPEILLELAVEAARSELAQVQARLEPMSGHLIALCDAGDQAKASALHAEIRAVVESDWLPAVKRLALSLHRVGRLPAEDEPLIVDELAAANGWRRSPGGGGWIETEERARLCVHCPRQLAEGDRLYCVEHRPVPGIDGCIFCHDELDGSSRLVCTGCGGPVREQRASAKGSY